MKKINDLVSIPDLALYGGLPVRTSQWPTYDKGDALFDEEDSKALIRTIESRRLFRYDNRPFCKTEVGLFENEVAEYFGVKFALAVTSGTTAIALALQGAGVGRQDFVACPSFTFAATPSAILLAGARPIIIEVDENLHFDVEDLKKKYTEKMKAIVVVHMRGFASNMEKITAFAKEKNIPVIEDAVPALGVSFSNKKLGTLGIAGAFSTQSDKTINTGEGGFIVTNDKELFSRVIVLSGAFDRLLRNVSIQNCKCIII